MPMRKLYGAVEIGGTKQQLAIVDDQGNELPPYRMGNLAIKKGWPSMMRQIWYNQQKYVSYFMPSGWYVSGDSAYMD